MNEYSEEEKIEQITLIDTESEESLGDIKSLDDNQIDKLEEKALCLVILDLLFSIFPEMKIFGQTVRDFLRGEVFNFLNCLVIRSSNVSFNKKISKMRKSLEIQGYHFQTETSLSYEDSWSNFSNNYLSHGISNACIYKVGSIKPSKIQLLFVSHEKKSNCHPIFRCDQLLMDNNGTLSIDGNKIGLDLMSEQGNQIRKILNDIHLCKLTLLKPLKIGKGYLDRFYRAKIIFQTVRLMEKGWEPVDFKLSDCGFNISLDKLELNTSESLKFFDYRFVHEQEIMGDQHSEQTEKDFCPICREQLHSQSIIKTNCGHLFHNICLFQHFHKIGDNSTDCPICRTTIVREIFDEPVQVTSRILVSANLEEDENSEEESSESNETEEEEIESEVVSATQLLSLAQLH